MINQNELRVCILLEHLEQAIDHLTGQMNNPPCALADIEKAKGAIRILVDRLLFELKAAGGLAPYIPTVEQDLCGICRSRPKEMAISTRHFLIEICGNCYNQPSVK